MARGKSGARRPSEINPEIDAEQSGSAALQAAAFSLIRQSVQAGGVVNDVSPPPEVDLNGGDPGIDFTGGYTEGAGATAIGNGITVTATDPVTQATITITDPLSGDLLTLSAALPGTISVSPSSTDTNLILTGTGTAADWEAALSLVGYSSTSDNPDNQGTDGARTLNVTLSDGVQSSAAAVATINITAVNDAPTATLPTSVVTDENVPVAITGLSISDAEMDPAIDEIRAKLVVQGGGGTLTIRTDVPNGVTAGQLVGNGTTAVFFSSGTTLDQMNATFAAADGVTFTPASGVHGTFQILFGATDGGVSGTDPGGSPTDESFDLFFDVTINALNSAPTLGVNAGDTVNEGAATTISAAALDFNDAEQADSAITYTVTTTVAHGTLLLNGSALGLNDSFTQADVNSGLLSYQHDGSETTTDSFGFDVSDGAGGTVTGQSFALTIDPVNDTPVNTVPVDFLVAGLEGQVIAVTGMQVSDADAGASPTFTVNLFTDHGYLHVDESVPGGASVLNNDDGLVSPVIVYGTLAEVNATLAALDGVTLHVDPEFSGDVTIGLTSSDGGATGADPGGAPGMEFDFDQFLVSVIPVNDAPVMDLDVLDATATGNDAAASYAIGALPVTLAPLAEFTDDNIDFGGATLTVSLTANGTAGDQLRINNIGTDLGEIGVSGNSISYEGVDVGTFTGGTDGSDLVITFNSAACHCAIQTVMENINFQVIGLTPDTDQRTISFTLVDGGGTSNSGADTATADVTVDITAPPSIHIYAPGTIAVGDETLVNTTTTGDQGGPATAVLGDGTYVVAWQGADGVYFQQYESDGTPLFGETKLDDGNTTQNDPEVVALADGGFALVYVADDGVNPGAVWLQRYDNSGNEAGDAVQVGAGGDNRNPQAAVLTNGDIVVTWQSNGGDSNVQARLLDSSGAPVTAEFTANSFTIDDQTRPEVAALADGGFRIVWTSAGQDGSGAGGLGVYSQRYDAHGTPVGGEVHFNTSITGPQQQAVVAGLDGLGEVIVWQDTGDIVQRVRNPVTSTLSAEDIVSAFPGVESNPQVSRLDDGGYVISWVAAGQDGDAGGIYAQRYDSVGGRVGGIILVNSTTAGNQTGPAVTGLDDGYLVTWTSSSQDGDLGGVYSQRYADAFTATEQVALNLKSTIHVADLDTTGAVTVTLSVNYGTLAVDPGTSGVDVNPLFPDEVELTGTVAEIEALLNTDGTSSVTYLYDNDFPPPSDTLTVTIDDGNSTSTDSAMIAINSVNDAPVIDLDFFTPGDDAVLRWTEGDGPLLLAPDAIFDDDNDSFDGAVLTVTIGGATSGDQLTVLNTGTGLGELGVSGSDITYEGVVVGSFTGGANGAPLVVTFNADACHCAVELTMASILYENGDDLNAASSRNVDFTLVDGGGTALGGADTDTASVALTVLPLAEVVAGAAAVGDEDNAIAITGVSLDGVAANPANPLTVRLDVAHGTLDIRTDVVGGIDASDVTGDGSGHLVIVATQDEINATLGATDGLTYQGDANFNGTDQLTIDALDASPATAAELTLFDVLDLGAPLTGLAMHDMDLDGTDDLVIGAEGGIVIFGSIIDGFPLTDPGLPTSFAFADFDGDGFEDIGFTLDQAGSGYVGYISSDTFDVVKIADIDFSGGLVTGDFDGNGFADMAVTDGNNGRIAVILQDSVGHFLAPAFSPGTTHLATALVAADFNGDNLLDLLIGNSDELTGPLPPGSVQLMLGNGDGTFQAAADILSSPANLGGIATGDFNGDGALDFAIASEGTGLGGVQVLLGNGDGSFAAPTLYAAGPSEVSTQVVAADLNGDGIADLAVTNFDDASLSILIGNGDGSFQTAVDLDTDDFPVAVVTGDPDDDDDADLVVGTNDGLLDLINNDTLSRQADGTKTIIVNPVDDPGVAQPDAFTITESGSIVGGNLFAANGSGVDSDPDGAPVISAVNGLAGNVGAPIILASGALLFVNADGTFGYNSNGVFVTTPDAGSGASNTPAHDSFTYTVAGGNTVTVSITLTGVDTDDVLLGTAGADILSGGVGDDTYYVQNAADQVLEANGAGNDRVVAAASFALIAGSSVETLEAQTGVVPINLTGNALAQALFGNAGANILDGKAGADALHGLLGNDWYYVDDAGDQVFEAAGEGNDRVFAGISFTLAAGLSVEKFTTSNNFGTGAINLTGNELGQEVWGNAGNNILNGKAGADSLFGLEGDDWFYVDNAADRIVETAGQGNDRLFASTSYILTAGASVEKITTTNTIGTDAINLTGNEFAQELWGNAGNNILDGKAGADVMFGLQGDDWYYVDTAADRVSEAAGQGNDRVFAGVSYTLAAGLSVEKFTTSNNFGTDAITLTGNELAQELWGNVGDNILDGKGGADALFGLGGADTFAFTSALGAGNIDRIGDFAHGVDKVALDDAIFTAIGPAGALNANAFVIGSAAADASDRIIYNNATGQLFYDADGTGGAAAVQFAILHPGLALTASDFVVI